MELFTQDAPYRAGQICCSHNGRPLAKIVEDSIAPDGTRLTTIELVIPRIVLAEFNTHRKISRNSASSRAIPVQKLLQRVVDDPYIPETWGRNGRGMQATEALEGAHAATAELQWLDARDSAVKHTRNLLNIGVHKQTTNRLLETFMWHTVIASATNWNNFLHLRAHGDAHPAIQRTAIAMYKILERSEPTPIDWEKWHVPYVLQEDWSEFKALPDAIDPNRSAAMVSSARCARVSYLTHDGLREIEKDLALHDKLSGSGHMSPFEHAAFASQAHSVMPPSNFDYPWVQYRKMMPFEHDVYSDPERAWNPPQ